MPLPGDAGPYKKLCAIVATRPNLSLELVLGPIPDDWTLRLKQRDRLIASVPFEVGQEDDAARDLAERASMGWLHL